ncbi:beta-galactosidase [Robinsoniella peoriensis]
MSVYFGVDYYPEHWPWDRLETDAQLMEKLGIQVVRMGEFSWAKFEPKKGEFHFEWLDNAVNLLARYGIKSVIGTPTAAPPAWIIEGDPQILPVDEAGEVKGFGGRHHDCQSSPVYREHIRRLVTAMAEHYKNNTNIIGWQIDNELGNSHEKLCMCDSCKEAFHRFLQKKYGSVERLNQEWGTVFWSQNYTHFGQIPVPRTTPTVHSPSLLLDWKRFCSHLIVDFQNFQVSIIKEICPHQQITHNLMGLYDKTDYFELAAELDFASNDQYPTGYYFDPPGQPDFEISACLDFIRSVKKKNFWMMELESGPTGGALVGRMPRPGQLKLWTSHCVAHGADTIVYFRWRTCLFGAEQFWHGILPHNGIPERRYFEIQETIRGLLPVMRDISQITVKPKAAILFSYDQDWAFQIQPHHPELNYVDQVKKYYRAFYQKNVPLDFISEKENMEDYKVVIAPLQFLMDSILEEKFRTFVKNGGHLVLTMRTGVKNRNNVCEGTQALPGGLKDVLGITVLEYDCLLGVEAETEWILDKTLGHAVKWCDVLETNGAESLAFYRSEFYRDTPAVTVNSYGRGKAYYVATEPDDRTLDMIVDKIIKECSLEAVGSSPDGVEMTVRDGREKDYLFVLNHTAGWQPIQVSDEWKPSVWCSDFLSGKLPPYAVAIYERDSHTSMMMEVK